MYGKYGGGGQCGSDAVCSIIDGTVIVMVVQYVTVIVSRCGSVLGVLIIVIDLRLNLL